MLKVYPEFIFLELDLKIMIVVPTRRNHYWVQKKTLRKRSRAELRKSEILQITTKAGISFASFARGATWSHIYSVFRNLHHGQLYCKMRSNAKFSPRGNLTRERKIPPVQLRKSMLAPK